MALTVSGKTYAQMSNCDTTASGGTWSGSSPVADSSTYKEGSASLSFVMRTSGNNDTTFTPTASQNLSGKHVRFWFLCTQGASVNLKASGGIQFWCSDGVNTAYWYIAGRDTYPGGWWNACVNMARAPDSGTTPTLTAITSMGIRINLTATAKNQANTWMDNLHYGDGLIVYGDVGGSYFSFEDIYTSEAATTGISCCIIKTGGVYFLSGRIEFGDSAGTSGCKFQATNQAVVFEDRGIDADKDLYRFEVVDNGTGTTEFIMGSKSGTNGISGCVVRVASTSQLPKFDVIATDSDISDFKLYGSTFLNANAIQFPTNGANKEVLNCSFEQCDEVIPDTCTVTNCNFISAGYKPIAFYSESNVDNYTSVYSGSIIRAGQTFTVDYYNRNLKTAAFYLKKTLAPTGNITCTVYATSGGAPTGSALATSGTVDIATQVSTSVALVTFTFSSTYTLTASTVYWIGVEYSGGDASNYLQVGHDASTPTQVGTAYTYVAAWSSQTYDFAFYAYYDNRGLRLATTSNYVTKCNFIDCRHGVNCTATGSYTFTSMMFASNTYDIENSTAGSVTINCEGTPVSNPSTYENTGGGSTTIVNTVSIALHVQDQDGNDVASAYVYIDKATPDVYTSASGNSQGDNDFIITESIVEDDPATGWLRVRRVADGTEQWYRYASYSTGSKTYTLRTKIGPAGRTCTAGGSSTVIKDVTNNDFASPAFAVGDTIRNETDGSWAIIKVIDSTSQMTTTPLYGGSDNTWSAGDSYSLNNLAYNYTASTDLAYVPFMNQLTDANGDASVSVSYKADRTLLIRVRKSSTGTRYQPLTTSGSMDSSGYSGTVVLIEDSIA